MIYQVGLSRFICMYFSQTPTWGVPVSSSEWDSPFYLPVAPAQTMIFQPKYLRCHVSSCGHSPRARVKRWSNEVGSAARQPSLPGRCDGEAFGGSMAESIPQNIDVSMCLNHCAKTKCDVTQTIQSYNRGCILMLLPRYIGLYSRETRQVNWTEYGPDFMDHPSEVPWWHPPTWVIARWSL